MNYKLKAMAFAERLVAAAIVGILSVAVTNVSFGIVIYLTIQIIGIEPDSRSFDGIFIGIFLVSLLIGMALGYMNFRTNDVEIIDIKKGRYPER